MKISLLTCSSKIPPWLDQVLTDYQKKISFWFPFELRCLRSPVLDREQYLQKIKKESELFMAALSPGDFVIACDEAGKILDSIEFSRRLASVIDSGKKRIVFIVGGAYGLSDDILKRADLKINLAPFTINHHLACAMISEQIYRGLTIIKNTSYHN